MTARPGARPAVLALSLLALLLVSACAGVGTGGATLLGNFTGTKKVALLADFGGDEAFLATYQWNAIQAEASTINAEGGLLGYRLEASPINDGGDPAAASALTSETAGDPQVGLLVGPSTTDAYLGAKSALGRAGIPDCVTNVWSDSAPQGSSNTFRVQPGSAESLTALLGYLHRHRSTISRIGMIYEDDADGHFLDQELTRLSGPAGLQYVGAQFLPAPGTDPTSSVQQLTARGAQAILLPGDPATAGQTATAVQQLGLGSSVLLVGLQDLAQSVYADTAGAGAAGTMFAGTDQPPSDAPSRWPPAYRHFVDEIRARYGGTPGSSQIQGSAAAADCVLGWATAVRRARSFQGQAVSRAWRTLDIPAGRTALGVREQFSTGGDTIGPGGISIQEWVETHGQSSIRRLSSGA